MFSGTIEEMIEFCKGTTWIGSKTIYIHICVELNSNDYEECVGPTVDVKTIANKALRENDSFYKTFPCLERDYFESVEVDTDDCYDDKTLSDMLVRRSQSDLTYWNEHYKRLYENEVCVEFKGKNYNCLIDINREK